MEARTQILSSEPYLPSLVLTSQLTQLFAKENEKRAEKKRKRERAKKKTIRKRGKGDNTEQ